MPSTKEFVKTRESPSITLCRQQDVTRWGPGIGYGSEQLWRWPNDYAGAVTDLSQDTDGLGNRITSVTLSKYTAPLLAIIPLPSPGQVFDVAGDVLPSGFSSTQSIANRCEMYARPFTGMKARRCCDVFDGPFPATQSSPRGAELITMTVSVR